jgi:IgA peptidase M64
MRLRAGGPALAALLGLSPPLAVADDAAPTVRAWLASGDSAKSVDIVFVGEGYQKRHLALEGKYWTDVKRYATRLTAEPPFSWYRSRLNIKAVFLESEDEGCNDAPTPKTKRTALGCQFDGKEGRLLRFTDDAAPERAVKAAGGVDIALVMVNTERYGGAGTVLDSVIVRGRPLPAPTFSARDTPSFLIALHELGHSFATLADEYTEIAQVQRYTLPKDGADLSEPNVTLASHVDRKDAKSIQRTVKWRHFMTLPGAQKHSWLHEGAYFRAAGVFRPWEKCRMLASEDGYCPICCEEMAKAIFATCGEEWDDAAYHKAHPLTLWK